MKKKWYLRSKYLSLCLGILLVFVVALVVIRVTVLAFVSPQLSEMIKFNEKYKVQMLQDLKALREAPVFPQIAFERNAHEVLQNYIYMEDSSGGEVSGPEEVKSRLRLLMKKYSLSWVRDLKKLSELEKDLSIQKLNTNWVESLMDYDYWSFSANPEIRKVIENAGNSNSINKMTLAASYSVPSMSELTLASAIYVLKAKDKNKAMKVYHHVGILLHSARSLIGNMVAVAHLRAEKTFKEKYRLKDWHLPNDEMLAVYKRVSWGWVGVFNLIYLKGFDEHYNNFLDLRNGFCAAVRERVSYIGGVSDFFENRWPFEISYQLEVRQGRKVMTKMLELCHMTEWSAFNEPTKPGKNPLFMDEESSFLWESILGVNLFVNPSAIPYLRGATGLIIMSVATSNPYSQYKRMLEKETTASE